MQKITFISLCLVILCYGVGQAQFTYRDSSVKTLLIVPTIGVQKAGGDWSNRFGYNQSIGLDVIQKSKQNWIFGISGYFIFGNDVKDNGVFSNILTKEGYVINQDGKVADVRISQRAYQFTGKVGRIFPLNPAKQNSGILVSIGLGFLEHKMRIETTGNLAPQLSEEYRKGYDKLSNGLNFSQFVGYNYLNSNKLLNIYAGFDFNQAFTKNRRSRNYDTMKEDTDLHLDFLNGFRLGVILPLYERKSDAYYYR